MGKNYFTDDQLKDLLANPYLKNATNKSITYTTEFKEYFVLEYNSGKSPSEILRNAGFDLQALGRRRIDNLSLRFRTMSKREEGYDDLRKELSGRPITRTLSPDQHIARLQQQIQYLKQENEFLKKINFLNKEAQWKFKRSQKKNSK